MTRQSAPQQQTRRIRNVNPIGAVDVPLLGRIVDRDEDIEVPADVAEALLQQTGNWSPAETGGNEA